MKVKFANCFNMIDRHLLDRRPVKRLVKNSRRGDGAGNLGIYLASIMVMLNNTDRYGDEFTIQEIAHKCGKSVKAVQRVISNEELYQHNADDTFCVRILCDVSIEEEQKTVDPKLNACQTEVRLKSDTDTPIYAGAKKKIKDKYIKRNTAEAVKETAATAVDFHSVIDKVFDDNSWLTVIERQMKIAVATNAVIRRKVKEAFTDIVQLNCVYNNGEPYNEQTVKRYFSNWIRPGSKSRGTLDKWLNEYLDAQRVVPSVVKTQIETERKEADRHLLNPLLEYFDPQGRRRGPHNEIVDRLAAPCPSVNMIYRRNLHKWVGYGS